MLNKISGHLSSEIKKIVLVVLAAAGIIFVAHLETKIDLNSIKIEFQKAVQRIEYEVSAFGQELAPYVYPRYPQRLIYLASAISFESGTLSSLNEELNQLIENCDCRYAQSQCEREGVGGFSICKEGPVKVFGDPCSNVRKAIEDRQLDIKERAEQLSYFKSLLEKEMEKGLEKELQILMPEAAETLKTNIEKIVKDSQTMVSLADDNRALPYDCSTQSCSANCQLGSIFSLKACLIVGTGEQKPINFKFKAGVKLDDLELGKIGIKNINLGLPSELQMPEIGDFSLTIPSQNIALVFPEMTMAELQSKKLIDLSSQSLTLNNQFSLPEIPSLSLSCPTFPSLNSSYQCAAGQQAQEVESIEYRWYFQTFTFLSEQCQSLPGMSVQWLEEKAKDCFDPEKLPQVIPKECDNLWADYCDPESPGPEPPAICKNIRYSCEFNSELAAAVRCQNLFTQERELIPSSCEFTIISNDTTYVKYPADFDPVGTLRNKCDEIKEEGRKDPPEPCKILSLFTGAIEKPDEEQYFSGGENCLPQEFGDFPDSRIDCPASPPTLPKISLPKIIIPDIVMPSFNIPPFLQIKLPSFIFEDLVLPDIDLCNLDDCSNIFPLLSFNLPSLSLPSFSSSLKLPDLDILFQGIPIKVPFPEIKTDFKLPSLPFFLPQLSLSNLLTPQLELPQFSLPKPKITFGFSGIDLSFIFDFISTFILNALGIPDFSLCINFSISAAPLRIIFPDYYFYWPAFPKIPEIPFCKDINQFCRNLKTSLKEVTDKVGEIEEALNQSVLKEIQQKIDQLSQLLDNEIMGQVNGFLEEYSRTIKTKIEEAISLAKIENGVIKIPPVYVLLPERKINIPLSDALGLPEKIPIPWPDELKKIQLSKALTYDLPSIPLSELSYEKEITIKGPGFQPRTISIDLGALGNLGDCLSGTPTGGNPCPASQFQNNLDAIQDARTNLQETSSKIIRIVETAIY